MKRNLKFTGLIAMIAMVVVLGLAINRWWNQWQDAASRTICKQNLKSIAIALHGYHDSNAHFPSAYSSSLPPHSWRVALLPWLDEQALFEKYNVGEAWNAGDNPQLLSMRPAVYACPEVQAPSHTSYQAAVSLRSPWPYDTPTGFADFWDGTANTVMLFDVHDPEVEWIEPKDLTLQQAADAVQRGQRHHFQGAEPHGIQVMLADGSVRYLSREINPEILHGLLTARGGESLPAHRMSKESLAKASEEMRMSGAAAFNEPIDSSKLPATQLSPGAGTALKDGNTFVYCPTMALAWKRYVQVMPQVTQTPLGTELLNNPFSAADIAASAIEIKISTASDVPGVNCKLKKHLAFVSEFDSHQLPLTFFDEAGPHNVKAFGVTSHWTLWRAALAQIRVIDYRSPDDFVIAIGNLSGEDLILAKVPRPPTLESGITDISARIRDSTLSAEARSVVEEQVVIPILELSVSADFNNELNHPDQPQGTRVAFARQIIQFRLDERGAVVWSEAGVIGENGGYEYTPGTRTFIFDKPFLIMLRESPDQQPYFASWIGNMDLMIPYSQE